MTKKQGVRAVLFGVVLIAILWWIDGTLRLNPRIFSNRMMIWRFDEMYTDQKNTWDGVIVGTSLADRDWAAPAAWEEYGMAVYPMSTDSQPFVLTSNVIEEVLKYQDVSFAVVELHGLRPQNLKPDVAKVRRVIDNMKRSGNWAQAISKTLNYMEKWYPGSQFESGIQRLSFYIPLIQFHSRLTKEGLAKEDFWQGETKMKGVYEDKYRIRTKPAALEANGNFPEATQQQKELLDDVIDCGERNGIQLIFLNLPSDLSDASQDSMNAVSRYVEEKGYPVLNFNDAEVLKASGLDGGTDFMDEQHLNTAGAYKLTKYLSGWLHENVEIQDHRGDERYKSWDDAAEEYREFYQTSLKKIEKWRKKHLK